MFIVKYQSYTGNNNLNTKYIDLESQGVVGRSKITRTDDKGMLEAKRVFIPLGKQLFSPFTLILYP